MRKKKRITFKKLKRINLKKKLEETKNAHVGQVKNLNIVMEIRYN